MSADLDNARDAAGYRRWEQVTAMALVAIAAALEKLVERTDMNAR